MTEPKTFENLEPRTVQQRKLTDLARAAYEISNKQLSEMDRGSKAIMPMIMMVDKEGDMTVAAIPGVFELNSFMRGMVLRGMLRKVGAKAYVMVSEAWTAEGGPGMQRENLPDDLSTYEHAYSVLLVSGQYGTDYFMGVWEIDETSEKRGLKEPARQLDIWGKSDGGGRHVEGNMMNLLGDDAPLEH